jgi:hypothetical protein
MSSSHKEMAQFESGTQKEAFSLLAFPYSGM